MAEVDGTVVGWTAITAITAVSTLACYAGVGESSVYVTEAMRGRGVGKVLLLRTSRRPRAGPSKPVILTVSEVALTALSRAPAPRLATRWGRSPLPGPGGSP